MNQEPNYPDGYDSFQERGDELLEAAFHGQEIDKLKRELDNLLPEPEMDHLEDQKYHTSDLGNAERMCRRYGPKLHYIKQTHQWLIWNGRIWDPDAESLLNKYSRRVIRAIYSEVADVTDHLEKKRLFQHAMRSEAANKIDAMLHILRWMENGKLGINIPIDYNLLDANPHLLNVANGTLDLRSGKIGKHQKEDLITKLAHVDYDPEAKSELWDAFLETVTNSDKDLRAYLQRAAGYSLLANNESEKLFYILGDTASGKSTFTSAVLSVLGDYGATADIQTFLAHKHQGLSPRDDLARLAGARMISVGETPEGAELQTALVKIWAGGDEIVARHLYSKHFKFRPGVLWLHANHRAKVPQDEKALFRRLRVIPFTHSIPEEKQDPAIKRDLCNVKLSGKAILAWLVQGCLAYQKDGLGDPQAVKQANIDYKRGMNPFGEWITERCTIEPGNTDFWESTRSLYDDYRGWCSENDISDRDALTRRMLGKSLATMELTERRMGHSNVRGWLGIQISAQIQNPENSPNGRTEPESTEVNENNSDLPF